MEDLFDDGLAASPTAGGLNRTGTYKCIQKLCPNCIGPHPKHECHSNKVDWRDYLKQFMKSNGDIPVDLFGNWINSVDKPLFSSQGNKPTLRFLMVFLRLHLEYPQPSTGK
jgi:hypothetical protein